MRVLPVLRARPVGVDAHIDPLSKAAVSRMEAKRTSASGVAPTPAFRLQTLAYLLCIMQGALGVHTVGAHIGAPLRAILKTEN